MSWHDFHQRQHAIQTVLDHARRNPSEALIQVPAPFTDAAELLRALHYKWNQQLTGRIDVALVETGDAPHGDRVEAVTAAWRQTAADNSVLRAVLDQHSAHPALETCAAREQRMLALAAGLAEHTEPAKDVARVGMAFLKLLRATPSTARRGGLRKLMPSS
ncbi:hypothetical protein MOQ72_27670 [Saccharopolyspora sp. K220]|uniref:hypothetical protein n=1 Tax=Saccharopolyspora soli TaxID=2926618 RepID=UPI001F56164B|nr:hypothetical protein [Saccharopolyspora soli]MCI2421226.1 hypothetical protein [Saccharopolyspora soli]